MSSLSLPSFGGRKSAMSKVQFWKRRNANITEYDPTYRVVYLGNVLTGWAKGDGCVDKPLSTLWRNHVSSDKADIVMKVTIVSSGLKAVTKEHGLTEYWANRITYCMAHPAYPRVFCWIYRHEGRKMKQELRCHAVLCPKEEKATLMATQLSDRLHQALVDFRKEKKARQDARLSLANSIHDNPSMPYRKLLLQAGTSNYKPPIERSKSAPKLSSIEEVVQEEEEEDDEEDDDLELCFGGECIVPVASVEVSPRVPRLPSSSPPTSSKNDAVLIFEQEEDSDDEDEIRDYMGDMVGDRDYMGDMVGDLGEADSAASVSPGSNHGRTGSGCDRRREEDSLSENSDSGHAGSLAQSLSKVKVTEQDTISDESGYSEEPIAGVGKEVTVVKVNNSDNCDKFVSVEECNKSNSQHRLEINLSDNNQPGQHITITSRVVPRNQPLDSKSVPISHPIESSKPVPISSHPIDTTSVPVSDFAESKAVPRSHPIDLTRLPQFDTSLNLSISPREYKSSPPYGESVSLPVSPIVSSPRNTVSSPRNTCSPIMSSSPRDIVSTSPRVTDLSVQGVLMSEFTTADKLRYIEKSKKTRHSISMVNLQEFCINI